MPSIKTGQTLVMTSTDGGLSPEQYTELAINRIVNVHASASPAVQEQARAFKGRLRKVLTHYFTLAQQSERRTIVALLEKQGHADTAEIIRRL
jgi:hypothetical protein